LSVVIACDGALDHLEDRLNALAVACAGIPTEVFVVHDAGSSVALPRAASISATTLTASSTLVPMLWGRGMAAARGNVVALTTTQFRVREGWAKAMLAGFGDEKVAGVGGRLALAPGAGLLDQAVFLIRYSEHAAASAEDAPRDIAGDNA